MFVEFKRLSFIGPAAGVLLAGCSSTPVDPGLAVVGASVAERTGQAITATAMPDEAAAQTARLLAGSPLGIDAAVSVALLNDPSLRARFEDLGIAAADLQQAGLLANPVLGAHIAFSNLSGTVPQLGMDLLASIGELLTRSARQRIAAAGLQSVRMELVNAVIQRIADVQRAYYAAVAARQVAALRRTIDEAAASRHELTTRYFEAGNISDLDLARENGDRELAAVERLRAEGDESVAIARLQQSMGLAGGAVDWRLPDQLPALPATEPSVEALLAQAASDRPDVLAARHRLEAATQTGQLAQRWRYLGSVAGGVIGQRETDGERVIGPQLQLGLPLFDRRDAQIARQEAQRRQAEAMLQAVRQQLHGEVREQLATLDARRRTADRYLTSVIPAHEKIVEIGQRYNNYMLLGVFELLAARQAEYGVYEAYFGAVRDYWLARVDLQRSLGGRPIAGPLPDGLVDLPPIAPIPPGAPPPEHEHEQEHEHGHHHDGHGAAPVDAFAPPEEEATTAHRHVPGGVPAPSPAAAPDPGATHEDH